MNEIKFDSLKNYFDEIDNNYEKKYKDEKQKNGKVSNSWWYRWNLKEAVEKLIEGFDIENLNNIKIDIMGRDKPTQYKENIGIFVLPRKHSISAGVYFVIKKQNEDQDVSFHFGHSDKSEPDQSIIDLMNSFDSEYGTISNISDNTLDDIAKDKINKFVELSIKYNFSSMKSKGGGNTWEEYEIPNISSPSKEKEYIEEKNNIINKLKNTPSNFILYGPPGTGKTYKTVDIAAGIIGGIKDGIDSVEKIIDVDEIKDIFKEDFHEDNTKTLNTGLNEGKIHFVTFHQNYSYEEFVGGLRPVENKEDNLRFQWKPGIFIKACSKALELAIIEKPNETEQINLEDWFLKQCEEKYSDFQDSKKYDFISEKVVLIIDEINRANISRVFGELITLIEDDKRIGCKHQLILILPNGDRKFGVPKNLIIMGTMNTADKSLALLDVALRRRFEFKGLFPKENLVKDDYQDLFKIINNNILKKKGRDFQIGHSYFMEGDIKTIIDDKVLPLLNEYFMGDTKKIKEVFKDTRNDTERIENQYGIEEKDGVLKYFDEEVNEKSEQ